MLRAYFKLNRHAKVALFVAPILIIFGWAAGDIWVESQAMKTRLFNLTSPTGVCDVMAKNCLLESGEFQLNIYEEGGRTTVNSTFPLDTVTLFLVDQQDQPTAYRMGMKEDPYYWYINTPLASILANPGDKQKMRIIVTVKGGQYIAEFYSQTGF